MSGARFIPLVCGSCSNDLQGRAIDCVAFCVRCASGWWIDGERLRPIATRHVTRVEQGGEWIALPFWVSPSSAAPAFLCTRPLGLTRMATKQLARWDHAVGIGAELPSGAQLPPRTAQRLVQLAGIEGADELPAALLAVPARIEGAKLWLPQLEHPLYREELKGLGSAAARLERSVFPR